MPTFDGVLGACTERPAVYLYSASCGGTRKLPTRHRERRPPSAKRGLTTGLAAAASSSTEWVLVTATGCAGGSAALPPRQ